jgi:hypothetical protein
MSSIDIPLPRGATAGRSLSEPAPLRIVLYRGETLRVPRGLSDARVLAGTAWLSADGKDTVLRAGERAELRRTRDAAVVSAVGEEALLIQLQ